MFRIGSGFDVHAFGAGDHVMLCGVCLPHSHGLQGHSDADVALHALVDALLGSMALGDIGEHFPPSEARWKNADSGQFVRHAVALVEEAGAAIVNIDLTIICEAPKITPHKMAMRQCVAELCGLEVGAVSVKATTSEGLGFTGRKEGIAAQAAVMVRV